MTTPIHLHGLRVEGYKRVSLVDVQFDPVGGIVKIMGENEAGKSSFLDAFEALIAGKKTPKQDQPINSGADSSRIIGDFGDIIVTRIYRANGTTAISVKAKPGYSGPRPEDLLASLYSHIGLDPLAFANSKPEDQVRTLVELIGFDPTPLEIEDKRLRAERLLVGRDRDNRRELVKSLGPIDQHAPDALVSATEILDEISTIETANRYVEEVKRGVEAAKANTGAAAERVSNLQAELDRLNEEMTQAIHAHKGARDAERAAIDAAAGLVIHDTDDERARLAAVEETNDKVRANQRRAEAAAELARFEADYKRMTEEIEEIPGKLAAGFASKPLPIPGLTVVDGRVHLEGTPFSQASTGAKIRTSTGIAMALGGALKVIVVRDANTLDLKNRAIIQELAVANGYQVLMELLPDGGDGVLIEAGTLAEVSA